MGRSPWRSLWPAGLVAAAVGASLAGAIGAVAAWSYLRHPPLPVLMYHKVVDLGVPSALRVPPQAFAAQMAYLACSGYHPIPLRQWVAHVRRGRPLPRRPIAITFDDGYADNLYQALPVLRRYGFPATVFVIAGRLGQEVQWPDERGRPRARLLTPAEVRALAEAGIEIGSHSWTHPDLTALPPDALARELEASRRYLEHLLGRPVRSLAYPGGRYDARVVAAARAAGYDAAVTTDGGVNDARTDLLRLRRIRVKGTDDLEAFRRQLAEAGQPRSAWERLGAWAARPVLAARGGQVTGRGGCRSPGP